MNWELRYAANPVDVKTYDTARLRKEFLIEDLFQEDNLKMVYSLYDRFITGGVVPVKKVIKLEVFEELKAEYFLQRREIGFINIGKGTAIIVADGVEYKIANKEALYLGQGNKDVTIASEDSSNPARVYINSAPAHKSFPNKKVTLADAEVAVLGSLETSNHRQINKLLVNSVVETCQLQMGMTELKPGSVWNTMPAHTHNRRMEVYLYFDVPEGQVVSHFMGEPQETRHIFMKNEQAVISPTWSIHSGAGTSNYTFIWGMAGENLDYGDMDACPTLELK